MPKKLVYLSGQDLYDIKSWTVQEVDDVCKFLTTKFDKFPPSAKIYHNEVSINNDVTPHDEGSIERLQKLEGTFYVVIYPAGPLGIAIAIFVAVAVIAVAAVVFLMPKRAAPPAAAVSRADPNRQATSPNNELSERKNTARVNGRIPDIYGQIRSTPDLIAVPYRIYVDHKELEIAYMCIGRGTYEIHDVRDDTTLIDDIAGSSVEIYGPNTSPNSGTPQLTIGRAIDRDVLDIARITAVNGQTILPPNDFVFSGTAAVFAYPNEIRFTGVDGSISDLFNPGEVIEIYPISVDTHQVSPATTVSRDFGGIYTISAIDETTMVLKNPEDENSAWLNFTDTVTCFPAIHLGGPRWVGPFIARKDNGTQLILNIVAAQGAYKDDGNQIVANVLFQVRVTPVNEAGEAVSGAEVYNRVVRGSSIVTTPRANTVIIYPSIVNNIYSVKVRRLTPKDTVFAGTVVDEIKWQDLYIASRIDVNHFGNLTTVQAATFATTGALAIKERKLNCLVTRQLKQRVSGSTFTSELFSTKDAADIISAICLDPFIGNRAASEVDFDNLYDTVAEIESYFGYAPMKEFCHTLDTDNVSFEETLALVAAAIFCTAYRRGNKIKIFFEKLTEDSTLLFNHRNKVPGSETRTVRFGNNGDNDGIELEYTSPLDDSILTYKLPADESAVNPKKIEGLGVRSRVKAHIMAWREFTRLQRQNVSVEFTSMSEGQLVIPGERILVADNTRANTQDGEIIGQAGLVVTTSQDLVFTGGVDYTVYLQLYDGTVDNIEVTAGPTANSMTLDRPPLLELVMDDDRFAKTTYVLSGSTDRGQLPFIAEEKESNEDSTVVIRASSYDERIYEHDTDYINDLIGEETNDSSYNGIFKVFIEEDLGQTNLRELCDDRDYPGGVDIQIILLHDYTIKSLDSTVPSVVFGDFDTGVTVTFIVRGNVDGGDGLPGAAGASGIPIPSPLWNGDGGDGGDGGIGGTAIDAVDVDDFTVEVLIESNGKVRAGKAGGGGGGGGGGAYYEDGDPVTGHQVPGGAGGLGNGQVGSTGSTAGGVTSGDGGDGGNLGDYGVAGTDGTDGTGGDGLDGYGGGAASVGGIAGVGGPAGISIENYSNITLTNNGTLIGATSG